MMTVVMGNELSDNHTPTVSVLIATYNRAQMLKNAIESTLRQTYQDFELIIVSDGSTDETTQIVASFDDPRIKFLEHGKNMGYPFVRNTGLKASRGKYIAFLDDDDEWFPEKLEDQTAYLENSKEDVGLVYSWAECVRDGISVRIHSPKIRGNVFVEMLDKQAIGFPSTIMIKREVLQKVGFLDTEYSRGSDGNYWRRIAKHYSVDFIPKVLAIIRIGHDNRISVASRTNLRNAILAFEKRLQVFSKDFDKHPRQKANVLANIAISSLRIGEIKKGLTSLWRMLCCNLTLQQRARLIYRTGKRLLGVFLRRFLHFGQTRRSR